MPSRATAERGFTLLEMLVVVAILGLALAVFATRGPVRSAALDLRAAGDAVAGALRLAHGRSIAANRTVGVVFDVAAHAVRLDNDAPLPLPPALGITVTATADNVVSGPKDRLAAIRFAPDGSSSGGLVVLAEGTRRVRVGVDWLTGRVSVEP